MLIVNSDNSIELTRGDTARLVVSVVQDDGIEYIIQPGDTITLSLKKSVSDAETVLQKKITGGNTIHIKPEDTAVLDFGRYKYDVQINTESGDVYTVLLAFFTLTDEVTT